MIPTNTTPTDTMDCRATTTTATSTTTTTVASALSLSPPPQAVVNSSNQDHSQAPMIAWIDDASLFPSPSFVSRSSLLLSSSSRLPEDDMNDGVTIPNGIVDILDTVLAILDEADDVVATMLRYETIRSRRGDHHHATSPPPPRDWKRTMIVSLGVITGTNQFKETERYCTTLVDVIVRKVPSVKTTNITKLSLYVSSSTVL